MRTTTRTVLAVIGAVTFMPGLACGQSPTEGSTPSGVDAFLANTTSCLRDSLGLGIFAQTMQSLFSNTSNIQSSCPLFARAVEQNLTILAPSDNASTFFSLASPRLD